jgi:hypothetical protein
MRASSLLALTASLFAASLYAGDTQRFSQSLTAEQRTTAGIDQLNSDQVAALDALVRLDAHQAAAATKKAAATASKPAAGMASPAQAARPPFTRSLSVDQRRAAGLDTLTAGQQGAVDTLVAGQLASASVRYEPSASPAVEAVEFFPNRYEVHGEMGLSFGGGSGYSSREAWMSTTLLDTKTGTAFSVGVSSGREKWKGPYRYRNTWEEVGIGIGAPLFSTH